jgi:TetR/AcrR family transcriptional regulator, mexCD-oprJ operon repressor
VSSVCPTLLAAELHRRHAPVLEQLDPLTRRGQDDGTFRTDVPSTWHMSTMPALVHAANAELRAKRIRGG